MSIRICEQLREHKEIIIAYLNGAKIQCYNRNYAKWYNTTYPNWDVGTKYRVKPEEVTMWLNVYTSGYTCTLRNTKEQADQHSSKVRIACIPITYTEGEGL